MNQFIFSLISIFSEHLLHIYMLSHEPGVEISKLQGILSAVKKVLASTMGVSRIEPLALPLVSEESLTEEAAFNLGLKDE